MRLKVGDGLRTDDWLDARRRLFESGLFRRVDIAVEPQQGAADTAPVSLRVTVEEWPALRLRYGFQVSEERPEENVNGRDLVPGVSADLTRRTLFGRAITVGAAGQYESLERLGRVFVNTPTLFGRFVQSSLTLERSREEFRADTLVTDRTTGAWEQRGRWRKLTMSYGLRFERNRTFDTGPPDPDFPVATSHFDIGRFTSSATWDTRDDAVGFDAGHVCLDQPRARNVKARLRPAVPEIAHTGLLLQALEERSSSHLRRDTVPSSRSRDRRWSPSCASLQVVPAPSGAFPKTASEGSISTEAPSGAAGC